MFPASHGLRLWNFITYYPSQTVRLKFYSFVNYLKIFNDITTFTLGFYVKSSRSVHSLSILENLWHTASKLILSIGLLSIRVQHWMSIAKLILSPAVVISGWRLCTCAKFETPSYSVLPWWQQHCRAEPWEQGKVLCI